MKKLLMSVCALMAVMMTTVGSAQMKYVEGKDYTVLSTPIKLNKAGEKEVVEFFSYVCPHCYNLEPHIVEWAEKKKPADVGFYQIPAVGGKLWTFAGRVKYVADKLKLGKAFDQRYFDELHQKKNRRLAGDKDSVIALMTEYGADKKSAEQAWDSLQVKADLKKSVELWKQAKLTGVPTVIVNGKYVVGVTTYETFFDIIEFLLETTTVPAS